MTIYSLDVLLFLFETNLLFHVQFYCCFMTCIQFSQEVVWFPSLYIYYCGQESLRRNGVTIIVNRKVWNAIQWKKCSLGISDFFEEISSLSHSIFSLCFFALIIRKAFLYLLAILWIPTFKWISLSFSPLPFTCLIFSAICKACSDNHFAFVCFSFSLGWS